MNINKRSLAILTAIAFLGTSGYLIKKNSGNPYNSNNVKFIHRERDRFSSESRDFLDHDFGHFEHIMRELKDGNYQNLSENDFIALDKYIDLIVRCDYDDMSSGAKSEFLINFPNYFAGSNSRGLINEFCDYNQDFIVAKGCRNDSDFKMIVENCTVSYHRNKDKIFSTSYFPKYIILKMIRPIIAANPNNYCYRIGYNYEQFNKYSVLKQIDDEIEDCLSKMQIMSNNSRLSR